MTKFLNHVDHVAWICHHENVDANASSLAALCGVELQGPWSRDDIGLTIYMSWEAGLELVAPHARETQYNRLLHDRLAEHGEGIWGMVFGVDDLEEARERARALGYEPSPVVTESAAAPWAGKVKKLLESRAGQFLDTWIIFGQIDYADGVISMREESSG